jgi:hypothetical protein
MIFICQLFVMLACICDIDVQSHLGNSKTIAIFLVQCTFWKGIMKFVYVILAIGYVSDYFNLITADLI